MITFREYIREIENNIEQNLLDQVIAHSSYILKTYPNSIDALRLIGQAYLEEKKYIEALPYFEKILSFIPDDFVSHVGISSIKEEDRDINSAIFHMELAFDTQPSNNIVQEELKRLIEKRDGAKPPKINLSKGALIRMYMKGELFQQALNEIESALGTSPNRMDLQVLLANVLYSSNSKVQAAETCNQIIERLPYCLEANRILYQIYLENGMQEQASIVKDRLITLNPYYQFLDSPKPEVEEIPDEKIELERLSYTSAFSANIEDFIPEVKITPKDHGVESPPQRLPSIMDEDKPSESRNDDLFPSFLSSAGWEKTDNPHNEPPELLPDYSSETSASPAEKGPLPDWLENFQLSSEFLEKKPAALPEESVGIINNNEDQVDTVTNIDFNPSDNLSSINEVEMSTDTPQSPFEKDESSDWMSQFFDDSKDTSGKPEEDKQLPDWLKSFEQKESTSDDSSKEETPDWLKSLDADIAGKEEDSTALPQDITNDNKNDEPDWFKSLVSENESQDESINNTASTNVQNEIEDQMTEPEVSSLSYLDSFSKKDDTESLVPAQDSDSQLSNDDDFLKSLVFSDNQSDLEKSSQQDLPSIETTSWESTSIDDASVEPNSMPSSTSDSIPSEPTLSETSEGSLPDWVKSVLHEPEETTANKEFDEEPGQIEIETPVFSLEEDIPIELEDASLEKSEGAISQETSEELLTWLKGISPDAHEEIPVEKTEVQTVDEVPQVTESLEDSLGRLQEISDEITLLTPESHPVEFEQEPVNVSAENQENHISETSDPLDITQEIEVSESLVENAPSPNGEEDLLGKLLSIVAEGKYTEATEYLPELDQAGIKPEEILEKINSLKPERTSDFNYFQFLGDTLSGFGHFEEAMDMYTHAEEILK